MAYIQPEKVIYISETREYNIPVRSDLISTATDAFFLEEEATYEISSSTNVAFSDVDIKCYCVTWLREIKQYNVRGDANTIKPNTDKPFVKGVVLLDYDGLRHVAGIKHILLDRILVEEANYNKCQVSERVIMLDDPHIIGYYYKNPNGIIE